MMKKIAIPVSQGKLATHFGHCKEFHFYEVKDSEIVQEKTMIPPPHQPGAIPKWISQQSVTDVIAGGMGQRAIDIFNQLGVNVFVGAPSNDSRHLVEQFLSGDLETRANMCDH